MNPTDILSLLKCSLLYLIYFNFWKEPWQRHIIGELIVLQFVYYFISLLLSLDNISLETTALHSGNEPFKETLGWETKGTQAKSRVQMFSDQN